MMRALYRSAAAFLILGVALFSITLALTRSDAALASSNTPLAQQSEAPRWEYKVLAAKSSEALMVQANQSGAESWELVNAVHVTDSNLKWVGFFKRRKQ